MSVYNKITNCNGCFSSFLSNSSPCFLKPYSPSSTQNFRRFLSTMLSRFIFRPSSSSHLRFLTLISSNPSLSSPPPLTNDDPATRSSQSRPHNPNSRHILLETFRHFSSNRNNKGDDNNGKDSSFSGSWKISPENDNNVGDSIFRDDDDNGNLTGMLDDSGGDFNEGSVKVPDRSWSKDSSTTGDVFDAIDKEFGLKKEGGADNDDDWKTADGYKPWSFVDDEKVEVFDIGEEMKGIPSLENEDSESETRIANKQLELEEERFSAQLKGPNRAFGDLIAASGISDIEIDSLILLKNVEHIEGLPPLSVIEDLRLERSERKSTNAEIERKKQEEVAKARVRQVDEKGRAYGTGRRKCSIARVWIQPGDGKFLINDKQFDVYFPLLDHRADLLRPFSETKTLGLWDVKCTVKGGGVSGQVGAVRLGISRALQNWEPGLRPSLRSEGFLTRDSRVVERKKPGKAKARKSFQWVKR